MGGALGASDSAAAFIVAYRAGVPGVVSAFGASLSRAELRRAD